MKKRRPPVLAWTGMFRPERDYIWETDGGWYEGLRRTLGMRRFWVVPAARTAIAVYVGRMEERWC